MLKICSHKSQRTSIRVIMEDSRDTLGFFKYFSQNCKVLIANHNGAFGPANVNPNVKETGIWFHHRYALVVNAYGS